MPPVAPVLVDRNDRDDRSSKDDRERARAVELAVGQIEKQFGKGAIMRLGQKGAIQRVAVQKRRPLHGWIRPCRLIRHMGANERQPHPRKKLAQANRVACAAFAERQFRRDDTVV